jgi:hypothetical protein
MTLGKTIVEPEKAVREAFPGAVTERRTDYLSEEQAGRIESLAGSPPSSRIVVSYRATREGLPAGRAYLETHLVRTLPETILVVLRGDGRVAKVEILSFTEPDDYLPRPRWLEQFRDKELDPELSLRSSIRGVTGATLTSRAITSAVRRVLATDQVLGGAPSPPSPAPSPAPPASPPKETETPTAGPETTPKPPAASPSPNPPGIPPPSHRRSALVGSAGGGA